MGQSAVPIGTNQGLRDEDQDQRDEPGPRKTNQGLRALQDESGHRGTDHSPVGRIRIPRNELRAPQDESGFRRANQGPLD